MHRALLALSLSLVIGAPALAAGPPKPADDKTPEIVMLVAAGVVTAASLGVLIATHVEAVDLAAEPPDAQRSEDLVRLSTQRNWAGGAAAAGAVLTGFAVWLLLEDEAPVAPVVSASADGGLLGLTGRF